MPGGRVPGHVLGRGGHTKAFHLVLIILPGASSLSDTEGTLRVQGVK